MPKQNKTTNIFSDPKKDSALLHIIDLHSDSMKAKEAVNETGELKATYASSWTESCNIGSPHKIKEAFIQLQQVCNDEK